LFGDDSDDDRILRRYLQHALAGIKIIAQKVVSIFEKLSILVILGQLPLTPEKNTFYTLPITL
jgi:hypothetical protein